MSIMPRGERVRMAVRWISEHLKEDPSGSVVELAQQAAMKFDLSPKESQELLQFYTAGRKEEDSTPSGTSTMPASHRLAQRQARPGRPVPDNSAAGAAMEDTGLTDRWLGSAIARPIHQAHRFGLQPPRLGDTDGVGLELAPGRNLRGRCHRRVDRILHVHSGKQPLGVLPAQPLE